MLRHLINLFMVVSLVLSCQGGPEPMVQWVPEFVSTEALVVEGGVSFSASVENVSLADLQCGFIYTVNGGGQMKIKCTFKGNSFHAHLDDFQYDTEYRAIAYIGNGKHLKYSTEFSVRTPQKPSDPSDSQTPTEPNPTDPEPNPTDPEPGPDDPVTEPESPVYELDIPFSSVSVEVEGGDLRIPVSGTVDFEVIVPEEADWLGVEVDAQSRVCSLRVDMNATESPRECELQFRSADPGFDCTLPLKVIQNSCPVHDIHMSYTGDAVPLCNFADMVGSGSRLRKVPSAPDWMEPESIPDHRGIVPDGVWIPKTPEYNGAVSRDTYFVVSGSKGTVMAHVIQHSPIDNIDFACPVMKQEAVKLWDINGDSEVSFYEAQQAEMLYGFDALNGKPVTSFDEYRFFRFSIYFKMEGSSIESIKFPAHRISSLYKGAFKNCDKLDGLKDYLLGTLGESTFEGCTSLTEVRLDCSCIDACVFKRCSSLKTVTFVDCLDLNFSIGDEVFSGCTSLESLILPDSLVAIGARAFYGCTSLRSLYFESATPPTISPDAVQGTHPDLVLYVPSSSENIYKAIWPSELAGRVVVY